MSTISEAWGFRHGDHVEYRTRVGAIQGRKGSLEGGWEWHRATVVAIDSNKTIYIRIPPGTVQTAVHNPKALRHWAPPSTPEDIARFLGEA